MQELQFNKSSQKKKQLLKNVFHFQSVSEEKVYFVFASKKLQGLGTAT